MIYQPRFLNRAFAFFRGYSWIPCPICKRGFGGHERSEGGELWITERDSVAVCPRCTEEADRRNQESGFPLVAPPASQDSAADH
jgi:hypothetical protein